MRSLLNPVLIAVALGHFVIDLNTNLIPYMLPFFRVSLGLGYAQTALVATCYSLTSSGLQPVFGYFSSRLGSGKVVAISVIWVGVFIGLAGYASSYLWLLLLVMLAGMGSSCFHPQGAANSRLVAGRNKATAVSIFSLGGISGYSLGPVVGAVVFTTVGLRGTALFVIPTVLLALTIGRLMSNFELERRVVHERTSAAPASGASVFALVTLLAIVATRAWIEYGLVTFTPLRFPDDLVASSRVLFVLLFSEALGTFVGAIAADRLGRRKVIAVGSFIMIPAIAIFVGADLASGALVLLAGAVATGLCLGTAIPVAIVMAQEALPRNIGLASGMMMGFAFVLGAIGVALNGLVADHLGLDASLRIFVALPLLAALLSLTLPRSLEAGVEEGVALHKEDATT